MTIDEEEKEEKTEDKPEKRFGKTKEQILDESFKKAESLRIDKPEKKEEKKEVKKPFIKLGIFITIIAIIGVIYVNFLPLMYINYETEYGSFEEFFTYEEFRYDLIESEEINSLFESTCYNCSENSDTYIGLTLDDFTNTPRLTIYIFIILAMVGIIFTIFIIIDRKKDFSEEVVTIVHSIFIALIIITGIIIFLINVRFLGAHLLSQLNNPFIYALGFKRVQIFFFTPYISTLFSFVFFIIGIAFMRINLNKTINKYNIGNSKEQEVTYRYGSKI